MANNLLAHRIARCTCGAERPSSRDLPFFEYRGESSRSALEQCECGYRESAHGREHGNPHICDEFRPRGDRPDTYYCGHNGWD